MNANFVDFANDLERNTEHDKSETLKRFKEEYPDYERIQQRTFTAWLHKYALYTQGIRFDERKSNGKALFSFMKLSRLDNKHISENLAIRKLIQAAYANFVDFANDLERNTEHDKSETLKRFKEEYPDYERIQQRTFTAWLRKYALYTQGIRFDERKSNGKALFGFVKLSRLDKN